MIFVATLSPWPVAPSTDAACIPLSLLTFHFRVSVDLNDMTAMAKQYESPASPLIVIDDALVDHPRFYSMLNLWDQFGDLVGQVKGPATE